MPRVETGVCRVIPSRNFKGLCMSVTNCANVCIEIQVPRVEAGVCRVPSRNFKGLCMSDTNCANVCIGEGFTGGDCDGLRRRCLCQKPC
ncbi:Defensin-like protein [Ananas comosus]|uniref:Defensin-like protein n=1 Tax=Ananas comosus TaxID=4615 RepID=A0A199V2G6_ANACO|nr:Defensin-like protein [Ananas comosus]